MQCRCNNPRDRGYANYGGRGIKFRFKSVMEGCLWIQENLGLHREFELDRINNDGHYEPGNLRYATRSMQARNSRPARLTDAGHMWVREKSPYAFHTSTRLLKSLGSEEAVIESAMEAVANKRKCWRTIRDRLIELGYMTS